jgi:hypothetical protein
LPKHWCAAYCCNDAQRERRLSAARLRLSEPTPAKQRTEDNKESFHLDNVQTLNTNHLGKEARRS